MKKIGLAKIGLSGFLIALMVVCKSRQEDIVYFTACREVAPTAKKTDTVYNFIQNSFKGHLDSADVISMVKWGGIIPKTTLKYYPGLSLYRDTLTNKIYFQGFTRNSFYYLEPLLSIKKIRNKYCFEQLRHIGMEHIIPTDWLNEHFRNKPLSDSMLVDIAKIFFGTNEVINTFKDIERWRSRLKPPHSGSTKLETEITHDYNKYANNLLDIWEQDYLHNQDIKYSSSRFKTAVKYFFVRDHNKSLNRLTLYTTESPYNIPSAARYRYNLYTYSITCETLVESNRLFGHTIGYDTYIKPK